MDSKTQPEFKAPPELPKAMWGEGPWQNEPDRVEFKHAGLDCLLHRNVYVTGAWCGYVAVPEGHPAFEKGYDGLDVDVHGGLTYADHCHGNICHTPNPGEADNVWWLGFDCSHAGDVSPRMNAVMRQIGITMPAFPAPGIFHGDTYKTMDYAKKETMGLADQLAKMGSA